MKERDPKNDEASLIGIRPGPKDDEASFIGGPLPEKRYLAGN